MRKLVTGCYAALLVLLVAVPAAYAAAPPQYQSSDPDDGATVHQPPDRVEVTFDQPLDPSSSLAVTDACDRRVDDGATEVSGSSMSVGLEKKPAGEYHVAYVARGLAGVTGENEGHFTFTAHAGQPCGAGSSKHGHHGNENEHGGGHGGNENHDEMEHGAGEHSSGEHGAAATHGTDHAAGATDHADHGASTAGEHADHEDGERGEHADHASGSNDEDLAAGDVSGITDSDTSRNLVARADSNTLMIALGLCVVLGILGGWILRTTGVR